MKFQKLYFTFALMLVCVFLSSEIYGEPFVTNGLVSYWTFDKEHIANQTAKDVWGKNDATLFGNPRFVDGQVKDALEFDGIDDYVNLSNLGDFGSQLNSSTFEAWVKTSYKEDWTTLVKVVGNECYSWGIDFNRQIGSTGQFFEDIDERDTFKADHIYSKIRFKSQSECPTSIKTSLIPISDGKWHHIVFVNYVARDSLRKVWYVDGNPESNSGQSWSESDTFLSFEEPVYLGAGNNKGIAERFFHGSIDEVRLYNRPLTKAEVKQNFASNTKLSVESRHKLTTVWGLIKKK